MAYMNNTEGKTMRDNTSRKAAHIGQVQKHAFNSDRAYRLLAWTLNGKGRVI